MTGWTRWADAGWRGWRAASAGGVEAWLAAAASGDGRTSRHARTLRVGGAWVKTYPAPAGRRALHAWRIGGTLARAGFAVPEVLLVARRRGEGLLVTGDVGGDDLLAALARCGAGGAVGRARKRALLRRLGETVGRLHAAGFVHGDLVPPNVRVRDDALVLLDHDRTRRGRLLVWWGGRRNLVQLGRFVVPGVTVADRTRVLRAYATTRRVPRRARRRLARWLVGKITARRCAIDGIPPAVAHAAGFRALMRAGGPFDPAAPRWRDA